MATKITRRQFVTKSAATATALGAASLLPRSGRAAEKVVKVGWIGAMTGPVASWGLPGAYGAELWADMVNAKGGIKAGTDSYRVEVVAYDNEFDPAKSVAGAKKLVREAGVKFIQGMWSTPVIATQPFLTREKIPNTTLVPIDLSPDYPYLFDLSEPWPFDVGTVFSWFLEQHPEIKRVAICNENEEGILQSLAAARAAFEVANVEIVHDNIYPPDATDVAPIVSAMLGAKPDLMCWGGSYPDHVTLLCTEAYKQGWRGPMMASTAADYNAIIRQTNKEFMEGYTLCFPEMDDPAMQNPEFNFPDPAEFKRLYMERWPDSWNETAWYNPAALPVWKSGVEAARSTEPEAVIEALRSMDKVPWIFGPAEWWGKELYGIDNALIGPVPVVQIRDGKPRIAAMADIKAWIDTHIEATNRHLEDLQLM